MPKEYAGTTAITAVALALVLLQVRLTGWEHLLPWESRPPRKPRPPRGEVRLSRRAEFAVIILINGLLVLLILGVIFGPMVGLTLAGFGWPLGLAVGFLAFFALSGKFWSGWPRTTKIILLICIVGGAAVAPGLLTVQLLALLPQVAYLGLTAFLLPANRKLARMTMSPLLWMVGLLVAAFGEVSMSQDVQLHRVASKPQMLGERLHPLVSAADASWIEALLYAPQPYTPGIVTTTFAFGAIGVMTIWARRYADNALVVWPVVGWVVGVAVGIANSVVAQRPTTGSLYIAVGVIMGMVVGMKHTATRKQLMRLQPEW